MSTTANIVEALRAAGIDTYDTAPATTPADRYVVVTGDSGYAERERYAGSTHWVRHVLRVMAVGRTAEGQRDLVRRVRDVLTDLHPTPESSPLREQYAGPELTDGPPGDVRVSSTLTYAHHTPRS